jgi:hypothetical protein
MIVVAFLNGSKRSNEVFRKYVEHGMNDESKNTKEN